MEIDKIAQRIAGLYLGSAILIIIGAILTLGEPFVILAGIGTLGLVTILGDAIAQYGIEAVLNALYIERSKKEPVPSLLEEIEGLSITEELKLKLKQQLISMKSTNSTNNQLAQPEQTQTVEIEV